MSGISLGSAMVSLGIDTSALSAGVNAAKSVLGDLASGNVGGAVATGLVAAGTAAVGLGVASIKMAGDFQTGMTSLVTGAGESQKNLAMVSQGILAMSTATGTSTQQLTSGMYMVESAGYHGAAGLQVLQTAAEGAKVGNADLGVTANALTTILTDYHLKSTDAASAMNALITTVASGKTHLQDLAGSMGSVLPLASSLGITFPQVGGAIATMTNAGMSAQRASMNLANAIRSLAAPGGTATKALKEVGLSAQELKDSLSTKGLAATLQMIEEHVGSKFPAGSAASVAAMKAIMGGATGLNVSLMLGGKNMAIMEGNVNSITAAMKNGKGSVQGWSDVQGDFNFKMDQAKAAVSALMIGIGTQLLPVVTKIVGAVVPVITSFSTWITTSGVLNDAISWLGNIFTTLGDILAPLGSLFDDSGSHATAMSSKTKASGSGMVSALSGVKPTIKMVADSFGAVTTAVKPVSDTVSHLKGMFTDLSLASKNLMGGGGKVASPLAGIMADIKPFLQGFQSMQPAFKQFANTLQGSVGPAFKEVSGIISGQFSSNLKFVGTEVQQIGGWFKSTLAPAIAQAMPGFSKLASVLISDVIPGLVKIWAIGQQVVQGVFKAFIPVIETAIPVFVKLYGIIANGLGNALQFIMPYIVQAAGAIGQFATEVATRVAPILINFFKNLEIAINVFMVVWKAVWPYLAPILKGVFDEIVGVVKVAWAIVSGIIKIGLDLLSGNWSQAWTDCKDMLSGIWSGIVQIVGGFVGIVLGWVNVLTSGVVNLFTGLWNALVGHSIIPDMVNGIISWFGNLFSRSIGLIQNMIAGIISAITGFTSSIISTVSGWVSNFINWFETLDKQAVSKIGDMISTITGLLNNFIGGAANFGATLIKNFASGITGAIGNVTSAIGNVVSTIGSYLPHSPAKQGELSHLNEYGPALVHGIATGIDSNASVLKVSMMHLVSPASGLGSPAVPSSPPSKYAPAMASGGNGGSATIHNHFTVSIDGQELSNVIVHPLMNEVAYQIRSHQSGGRAA